MRKFSFLLLLFSYLQVYADDYRILQLNTNSIRIGNVQCKQGDTFPDDAQICWSHEQQAIKAMNLKTKRIRVFACKAFTDVKAKDIKDYYIKSNHLSTRVGVNTYSDLAEELSDTVYVLDNCPIESPVKIDSLSSYLISYGDKEKIWRNLMTTDKVFYLNRELFEDSCQESISLSLYFRRKGLDDYLITDSLIVVVLPEIIDE